MDLIKYKERLITWFKSGNATDEQYEEMAGAIVVMSTWVPAMTKEIDKIVRDNDE